MTEQYDTHKEFPFPQLNNNKIESIIPSPSPFLQPEPIPNFLKEEQQKRINQLPPLNETQKKYIQNIKYKKQNNSDL